MDLPNIALWNAGAEHDADTFNDLSDAQRFLLNPPEVCVRQTVAQSIPVGLTNATALTFDTKERDNEDPVSWDAATPTYITIQTPGWYEIEWAVSWATRADNTLRLSSPYLNGVMGRAVNSVALSSYLDVGATTPQIWQTYDAFLNVGDKVSLGVCHASATALSTASSPTLSDQQTFLRVRWASL